MPDRITNSFSVAYHYPVVFTHDAFALDNPVVADLCAEVGYGRGPTPGIVLVDEGLAAATPGLVDRIAAYARAHTEAFDLRLAPVIVAGGERAKDGWHVPEQTVRLAMQAGLCRHSLILAAGGGAMLDAVGMGAALYHRGARLVRLPSTVLSQGDSGVGVKNGVNVAGVKNLLGVFAPPAAVVNDVAFLRSLPDRDWIAGIAEAFKVAVIRDVAFLDWLTNQAGALRRRDQNAMERLVRHCAALHCTHIAQGGDPFESGSARPLDFGHWSAHRLEASTQFALRHGEAVAIGMALDLIYAGRIGLLAPEAAEGVIRAMSGCGLPVWHSDLARRDGRGTALVLAGLAEFRQHLGGVLHITLPAPLGRGVEVTEIHEPEMSAAIGQLATLAGTLAKEDRP